MSIDHEQHLHKTIKESIERHGHSQQGSKAHLQEMLARDDISQWLRWRMQMALNRHVMHERRQQHEKDRSTK